MDRVMDTFAPFAPTVVTDHRPGIAGEAPVGVRRLVAGALNRHRVPSGAPDTMGSVEALVVFDFGMVLGDEVSPVNAALASVADRVPGVPVLAQHESARALAGRGRLVIDLEETARSGVGLSVDAHVETSRVVDVLAGFVDRAGWTSVGVIAHPAHIARCVATCQRLGLRVVAAPTDHLAELWDPRSAQWWTRRPGLWSTRELAVVAHQVITGRVLLRW